MSSLAPYMRIIETLWCGRLGSGRMACVSEQPGRYQRSTSGLIGAMVVLLLVVAGFVAFRAINRNDASRPVATVPTDQVRAVTTAAREAGMSAWLPTPVPAGWRITSISFVPGERPTWHVGMLTKDDQYVGIEERTESVPTLVATYVDKEAVAGTDEDLSGRTWATWTDSGGDFAMTTTQGPTTYLIGGSATPDEVRSVVSASVR